MDLGRRIGKAYQLLGIDGEAAVRIHRGTRAAELQAKYPHRVIPSRWHEKWKDKGDDHDNKLPKALGILKHLDAKSRWVVVGFHDPDIAILNRSVPTPETYDVPLVLQF